MNWLDERVEEIYRKYEYAPPIFSPWDKMEIKDYCPAITTRCGAIGTRGTILINEQRVLPIKVRKN